jgi:hypothetical protein
MARVTSAAEHESGIRGRSSTSSRMHAVRHNGPDSPEAILPFRISVSDSELVDLREPLGKVGGLPSRSGQLRVRGFPNLAEGARGVLTRRLRLARVGREAQRVPAVRDDDRGCGRALPARSLAFMRLGPSNQRSRLVCRAFGSVGNRTGCAGEATRRAPRGRMSARRALSVLGSHSRVGEDDEPVAACTAVDERELGERIPVPEQCLAGADHDWV